MIPGHPAQALETLKAELVAAKAEATAKAWSLITANFRTGIVDFRGFDSSVILILRGGILRPIGDSRSFGRVSAETTLGDLSVCALRSSLFVVVRDIQRLAICSWSTTSWNTGARIIALSLTIERRTRTTVRSPRSCVG